MFKFKEMYHVNIDEKWFNMTKESYENVYDNLYPAFIYILLCFKWATTWSIDAKQKAYH